MARREQFDGPIECPKCHWKGRALWEENENPMHHGGELERELLEVPKGFRVGKGRNKFGDPIIECEKCKVAVVG